MPRLRKIAQIAKTPLHQGYTGGPAGSTMCHNRRMTTSTAAPPRAAPSARHRVRVVTFVPGTLAERLRDAAERNHRSVAGELRHALARYIAEQDDSGA